MVAPSCEWSHGRGIFSSCTPWLMTSSDGLFGVGCDGPASGGRGLGFETPVLTSPVAGPTPVGGTEASKPRPRPPVREEAGVSASTVMTVRKGRTMADPRERVEVSEAEVAVHWKEEQFFYPPLDFIAQANMTDEKIYGASAWTTSRTVSGSTPTCSTGTITGTRPWTRATPPAGSGSSGARSTPATTASIGTWPSTATRRP